MATRSLSTWAPLPQSHVFSHLVVPSQLRGALTPLAVDPKFGMTCKVDVPGDAWFRQARGPATRMLQKEGYLPRVDHCSIHVVLPSELRIAPLVRLGTIAYNLHIVWKNGTVCISSRLRLVAFSRPFSLPFPSSWPGTASFTLLPLSMPPGNSCRAGSWHTCCKPRVGILNVYFSSDTTAARSRDLVVCMLLSFLLCILTSRCGA